MGNSVTLHSACAYSDLRAVRALLRRATPAELEAADDSGRTPLLVAVAAMAFKADGDSDDDDDDAFFGDDASFGDAVSESDESETSRRAGSSSGNGSGAAAHDADAGENEAEDVEAYSDGASVEPLSKHAEILHLLLQRHVNLDHADENGWTALHHACFGQNPVAIKMLVHAGAQPMRDKFGLLPQVRLLSFLSVGVYVGAGVAHRLVCGWQQDFLLRGQSSEWVAQVQDLKETLDVLTDKAPFSIKLLAFRPSGIVQLDLGGQVEKGSLVTCASLARFVWLSVSSLWRSY